MREDPETVTAAQIFPDFFLESGRWVPYNKSVFSGETKTGAAEVIDNDFTRLLQRAREGDEFAQTQLYCEYVPHVRRVIRHRLRDLRIDWAVEPDDVFDSVFVGLWKPGALRDIRDARHFLNYLEKAARNKAQHVLRKMARARLSVTDVPAHRVRRHVETEREGIEFDDELTSACAKLTGRERLICILRNGGHTWEEIGSRLRINPDAARKTHARAEARIRSVILRGDRGAHTLSVPFAA